MDWAGRIRAALDFQTWYAGDGRKWRYGGSYPQDADARKGALRFCGDPDYENLREVRALRDLLGLLGADKFFDEDIPRRPWLIVGSFCEFFSLERFGLSDRDFDPDIKPLFPVEPVLSREDFSAAKFSVNTPRRAAGNLAQKQAGPDTTGLLFKDIMVWLEKYYASPRNYRWELQRVGNPDPSTPKEDYKRTLGSILASLEGQK
jgi:hypothetical protein